MKWPWPRCGSCPWPPGPRGRLLDAIDVPPLDLEAVHLDVGLDRALGERDVVVVLDAEVDLALHEVGGEDVVLLQHRLDVVREGQQDLHAERLCFIAIGAAVGLFEV